MKKEDIAEVLISVHAYYSIFTFMIRNQHFKSDYYDAAMYMCENKVKELTGLEIGQLPIKTEELSSFLVNHKK